MRKSDDRKAAEDAVRKFSEDLGPENDTQGGPGSHMMAGASGGFSPMATGDTEGGAAPQFGLGISGSVSVNMARLQTEALLSEGANLSIAPGGTGDVAVRALNNTDIGAFSGSASFVRAGQDSQGSAAIAGAAAVNDLANKTSASLVDATVDDVPVDDVRRVDVQALAAGDQLAIGIGAAVNASANNQKAASAAGSVSLSWTNNEVSAAVDRSTLMGRAGAPAPTVSVVAYDRARLGTGGGSLVAGGKGGFGAAVTYSSIENSTSATISDTTVTNFQTVDVRSRTAAQIGAGGAMIGLTKEEGSLTLGGAFVISEIHNVTAAEITGVTISNTNDVSVSARDVHRDDIEVETWNTLLDARGCTVDCGDGHEEMFDFDTADARDWGDLKDPTDENEKDEFDIKPRDRMPGSSIISVAGVVQAGKGSNVGLSVVWNDIKNEITATVIDTEATVTGAVNVTAVSNASIMGFAVGAGVGQQFAGGGSLTNNMIRNTTAAEVTTTKPNQIDANSLRIGAADSSEILAVAGQVAVSLKSASAGLSLVTGLTLNETRAALHGTGVTVTGAVNVEADNDARIMALSITGAASRGPAVGGAVTLGLIHNKAEAAIAGDSEDASDVIQAGSLGVTANNTADIATLAGQVSVGFKGAAVGGAFGINLTLNETAARLDNVGTDVSGHAAVESTSDALIRTISVAGSASGGQVAVGGSISGSHIQNKTVAELLSEHGHHVGAGSLKVHGGDRSTIHALSGQLSASLKGAGIGASLLYGGIMNESRAIASGVDVTTTGDAEVTANNQAELVTIGISIAAGAKVGVSGSLGVSLIQNNAVAEVLSAAGGARTWTVGKLVVDAADTSKIRAFAGQGAGGGTAAVGAALAHAHIMNTTRASVRNTAVQAATAASVTASNSSDIQAAAAGGGVAGTATVTGSGMSTFISNKTVAEAITDGADRLTARALTVEASDTSKIWSFAGNVQGAGTAAVGGALSNSMILNESSARLSGFNVSVTGAGGFDGAAKVAAANESTIETLAFTGGAAGKASVQGSFTNAIVENKTIAAAEGAGRTLKADKLIVSALDKSKIESVGGGLSVAGTAAVGAAIVHGLVKNETGATLSDYSVDVADNAAVTAANKSTINTLTLSGGAAGVAAVSGALSSVEIFNVTSAEASAAAGTSLKAGQLFVQAEDLAAIETNSAEGGGAGTAAVGGALANAIIGNRTVALLQGYETDVRGTTEVVGRNESAIQTFAVSAGGAGVVAAQGSIASSHITNETTATIKQASAVNASNAVEVGADDKASISTIAGAGAVAGTGGLGATVAVNRIANKTSATVDGVADGRQYRLGSLVVRADSAAQIGNVAAAAGGGAIAGVSGSVATNFITNETKNRIIGGADIVADNDVAVIAESHDVLTNLSGTLGIGISGVGAGASVTVNELGGRTVAAIEGADTKVTALARDGAGVPVASGGIDDLGLDDLAAALEKIDPDFFEFDEEDVTADVAWRPSLTGNLQRESVRGVAVSAVGTHSVVNVVGNAAFGMGAGVAGTISVSMVTGATEAYVQDGDNGDLRFSGIYAGNTVHLMAPHGSIIGGVDGAAGARINAGTLKLSAAGDVRGMNPETSLLIRIGSTGTLSGAIGGSARLAAPEQTLVVSDLTTDGGLDLRAASLRFDGIVSSGQGGFGSMHIAATGHLSEPGAIVMVPDALLRLGGGRLTMTADTFRMLAGADGTMASIVADGAYDISIETLADMELGVIETTGQVALRAGTALADGAGAGTITQLAGGRITGASLLRTESRGAQDLRGDNTVGGWQAINLGTGDIDFINTSALLSVGGVETGAMVRITQIGDLTVTGNVASTAGDIVVSTVAGGAAGHVAAGDITIAAVVRADGGGVTVVSPGGAHVTDAGAVFGGANDVSVITDDEMVIDGVVETASDLVRLTAEKGVTVGADGFVRSGQHGVEMTTPADIVLNGRISTPGVVTLEAGGKIDQDADCAIDGGASLVTKSFLGQLLAGANVLSRFVAVNAASGNIALHNASSVLVVGAVTQRGGDVRIVQTGNLTLENSVTTRIGSIVLEATGDGIVGGSAGHVQLLQTGAVLAGRAGGIKIDAAGEAMLAGEVQSDRGAVEVHAGAALLLQSSGTVATAGDIDFTAGDTVTLLADVVSAAANVSVKAGADLKMQSLIAGAQTVTLTAGRSVIQSHAGRVEGAALLHAESTTGQELTGANTVLAFKASNTGMGHIVFANQSERLTIRGIDQGGGDVSVHQVGHLLSDGAIHSTGTVRLTTVSGTTTLGALVQAAGAGGVEIVSDDDVLVDAAVQTERGAIHVLSKTGHTVTNGNVTSTDGNVTFDASASIVLAGEVSTAGEVRLYGGETVAQIGIGRVVGASLLHVHSHGGQSLTGSNSVAAFRAENTGTGAIQLTNAAALLEIVGVTQRAVLTGAGEVGEAVVIANVGDIFVTGAMEVHAGGNVAVESKAGGGSANLHVAGPIEVAGPGRIDLSADDAVRVEAPTFVSSTDGGVRIHAGAGAVVDGQVTALSGDIDVTAGGDVSIEGSIIGDQGTVTVVGGGDIVLDGLIRTPDVVTMSAAGPIVQSGDGAIMDASLLSVESTSGMQLIGQNAVWRFLGLNAVDGGIRLHNSAPSLEIVGVRQGQGAVEIMQDGDLVASGDIGTTADDVVISVTGTGQLQGDVTTTGGGRIEVETAADLLLTGSVANDAGDILLRSGTDLEVDGLVLSDTGAIDLLAGGSVALADVISTTDGVTIRAQNSIVRRPLVDGVVLDARDVTLEAAQGHIGTSDERIGVRAAGVLNAAAHGDIWLWIDGDLTSDYLTSVVGGIMAAMSWTVIPTAAQPAEAQQTAAQTATAQTAGAQTAGEAAGQAAAQAAASLVVQSFLVGPSEILSDEELAAVTDRYVGRPMPVDELYVMIAELDALYEAKGFVARAMLPPQTIADGIVQVQLVEGRINAVVVDGNKHTRSDFILDRVGLQPGDLVDLNKMAAGLAAFNATYDVALRAELRPGTEFGTTDYMVYVGEPENDRFTFSTDNGGRAETGADRHSLTWTRRSLLGFRDPLSLTVSGGVGSRSASLSYAWPIGRQGSRLSASYSFSQIDVIGGEFGELDLRSDSTHANVEVRVPFTLRDRPGSWSLAYTAKESGTYFEGHKLTGRAFGGPRPGRSRLQCQRRVHDASNRSAARHRSHRPRRGDALQRQRGTDFGRGLPNQCRTGRQRAADGTRRLAGAVGSSTGRPRVRRKHLLFRLQATF